MFTVLRNTWALFFGFGIISLAHGLQGSLIGVRSIIEGFSFISAGLVVAGYYVGYLSGSVIIPVFLKRVGHIRVFAALASIKCRRLCGETTLLTFIARTRFLSATESECVTERGCVRSIICTNSSHRNKHCNDVFR